MSETHDTPQDPWEKGNGPVYQGELHETPTEQVGNIIAPQSEHDTTDAEHAQVLATLALAHTLYRADPNKNPQLVELEPVRREHAPDMTAAIPRITGQAPVTPRTPSTPPAQSAQTGPGRHRRGGLLRRGYVGRRRA
jgi:hypothetical protein